MDYSSYLFLGATFVVVFGAAWTVMRMVFADRIRASRLSGGEATVDDVEAAWVPKVAALVGPAARLSLPKADWSKSSTRRRLVMAGYRGQYAPVIYYGAKTVLAGLFPLIAFVAGVAIKAPPDKLTIFLFLVAAIGYLLPNVILTLRLRRRQRDVFEAFPEALDLMVVCVEAGLALDAAISRVGEEIYRSSPVLGDEFKIASLELRAGLTREAAFKNLAARTGVEDVDMLVAMLVQSEKFGTSIASALRVHADGMRTRRMLRAEEAAQKLPVKLVFPVVLLIFPALFLVLLGPSLITLTRTLGPLIR